MEDVLENGTVAHFVQALRQLSFPLSLSSLILIF